MDYFVKKPCKHCPFRKDVKPFLTPERGEELAYGAANIYNSFPCHKTTKHDNDGDVIITGNEKECAGFLTLQIAELGNDIEGFEPSYELVYGSIPEMVEAYEEREVEV